MEENLHCSCRYDVCSGSKEDKTCSLCQNESCEGSRGPVSVLCLLKGLACRYGPKGNPLLFDDGHTLRAKSTKFPKVVSTIVAIAFESLPHPVLGSEAQKYSNVSAVERRDLYKSLSITPSLEPLASF